MLRYLKWCFVSLLLCRNIEGGRRQKHGREVSPKSCEEGSHVLNECEERCECRDGQLINCYRVRKEFTNMEVNERRRYINAYKTASMNPAFKKQYERLVTCHTNTPNDLLHDTPRIFFPWHRWFLVEFENLLRRIDCRVTLPYWDWSRVARHWWNSSDSKSIWNASDHGLGGNGTSSDDGCVEDGPFSKKKWRLLKQTGGGCLRRDFYPFKLDGNTKDLKRTLALPLERFSDFEEIVREEYHSQLHNWIGGTMQDPFTASNAPEMVFHHAFLDKIWLQWQNKGEDYKNVYFPTTRDKLLPSKYYSWEWLDSSNLPGGVKVTYED